MIVGRIEVAQSTCLVTLKMQPLRARLSYGAQRGMTVSRVSFFRPGCASALVALEV
jgi:hypothetical protein